jgi:hypothetical protein
MKDVFIVTTGEYSDYRISGVFDSKELASKFIDSFAKDIFTEYQIEVWALNPYERELNDGYSCYYVSMNKDGSVEDVKQTHYDWGSPKPLFRKDKMSFYAHLYAKDENHAVKIMNEKRTVALANNTWGDNRYTL